MNTLELSDEAIDFLFRYLPSEIALSNEELVTLNEVIQAFAPFHPDATKRA